jgi:transcriptional regulator with XRE-family HTH domain
MKDARDLVDALKQVVRLRGLTYAELARRIGLSEASVKRLFSQRSFTLARLEQCCVALDVDFLELARLARGREGASAQMTMAQETALAGDAKLMGVFYLVLNGWTAAEIVARYQLTAVQCTHLLAQLDRLGLVDLMPGERVRLKLPRDVRLRADGPIRRKHGRRVVDDFLAPQFDRVGGLFAFEFRELSRASFEILKRKLARLAEELHQLADVDAHLPPAERETIGVALGIRPWSMASAIELALRRKAVGG